MRIKQILTNQENEINKIKIDDGDKIVNIKIYKTLESIDKKLVWISQFKTIIYYKNSKKTKKYERLISKYECILNNLIDIK